MSENERERVGESGWEQADRWAAGKWLKLEDGESCRLIFLGPPVEVEKTFKDKTNVVQRFSVYNVDLEKPQTLDAGKPAFYAINKMRQKVGAAFDRTVFILARQGSGFDTSYLCTKDRELKDDELKSMIGGDDGGDLPL